MKIFFSILFFSFFLMKPSCFSLANTEDIKLIPSDEGIYHAAFPFCGSSEDIVTKDCIQNFESLAKKSITWVFFSDNWFEGIKFPQETVNIIKKQGKIPFIRLMPRSSWQEGAEDPIYKLDKIINGDFDSQLIQWAKDAKLFNWPIIIVFAVEPNGDWFPWSGKYSGAEKLDGYADPTLADGPERYRDAYRHIINLFKKENVNNITWAFHLNASNCPEENWNNMSAYYPGDEYIDWIGISVYGANTSQEPWLKFTGIMNQAYSEMINISPTKPLAIFEWGIIEGQATDKAQWLNDAFTALKQNYYPRIKAISYWHSKWVNDDGTISNMLINSSPEALTAYRNNIADNLFITKPKFSNKNLL